MVYKRSKVMEAYLEMRKAYLKPFNLYRHEDVSGVSGNGVIAYGVEFPDGTVVMRWIGKYPTTVMHDKGIESIKAIHGHDGKTEVIWTEAAK